MSQHRTLIIGGEIAPEPASYAAERGITLTSCKAYPGDAELVEAANQIGAEALILRMGSIPRTAIERIPTLKIIAKHGVGYDTIDTQAASENGVIVVVAGGANSLSVAEQALALLMSVARSTAWLDNRVRNGYWDKSRYAGIEISGRSIGLIGLGAIGRAFLRLLTPFDVTARVYDPFLPAEQLPAGVQKVDSIPELLQSSDVVSLHCPLTDDNQKFLNAEAFAMMKPGAILINTARGGLIDQDALVEALRSGALHGAGLDTFAHEPPPADDPLWSLPNVVVAPHVGANTLEARIRVGKSCVAQIADYLDHGAIDVRNHVNAATNLAA